MVSSTHTHTTPPTPHARKKKGKNLDVGDIGTKPLYTSCA